MIKVYILVVQGMGILAKIFHGLVFSGKPCAELEDVIEHRLMLPLFAESQIDKKIIESSQAFLRAGIPLTIDVTKLENHCMTIFDCSTCTAFRVALSSDYLQASPDSG